MLKNKIYVFFMFLICVLSLNIVYAKEHNLELLGKVIYLDAGHGGLDVGATYKGVYEKDINLNISLKLEEELIKKGAIVYQTRYGDYDLSLPNTINRKRSDLSRRGNLINKSNADLFLSIHLNAEETGQYRGPQVFYNDKNNGNEYIAKLMQKRLNNELKGKRKYKKNNSLYLQKRINIPGVLVEVGFLSNANDRYLLKSNEYQDKVVKCIVNVINDYFDKIS